MTSWLHKTSFKMLPQVLETLERYFSVFLSNLLAPVVDIHTKYILSNFHFGPGCEGFLNIISAVAVCQSLLDIKAEIFSI